jgi:hypothetical protein
VTQLASNPRYSGSWREPSVRHYHDRDRPRTRLVPRTLIYLVHHFSTRACSSARLGLSSRVMYTTDVGWYWGGTRQKNVNPRWQSTLWSPLQDDCWVHPPTFPPVLSRELDKGFNQNILGGVLSEPSLCCFFPTLLLLIFAQAHRSSVRVN